MIIRSEVFLAGDRANSVEFIQCAEGNGDRVHTLHQEKERNLHLPGVVQGGKWQRIPADTLIEALIWDTRNGT